LCINSFYLCPGGDELVEHLSDSNTITPTPAAPDSFQIGLIGLFLPDHATFLYRIYQSLTPVSQPCHAMNSAWVPSDTSSTLNSGR